MSGTGGGRQEAWTRGLMTENRNRISKSGVEWLTRRGRFICLTPHIEMYSSYDAEIHPTHSDLYKYTLKMSP